jgi:cyclopropane fatty-acyl-phospholipid synthase-like methyltransferase
MTSGYFQTRYEFNSDRKRVWKAICEYLSRYIPPDSSVLELGSGYCDFINNIVAKNRVAVDMDKNSGSYCDKSVSFLNIKATDIEFAEKTFNIVFASNLFEHLDEEELDTLIGKITKILKNNGKLIIIQPNYYYAYREYWDDYTHKKAFSHVSLSDYLASNGFNIRKIEKRFLPYSFKSRIPKSYILTKIYLLSFWHPLAKQMLIIAEKQDSI